MQTSRDRNTGKLMKAAIELIKENGYSKVTVNQICTRAGVSRSSFYSMYSTKDDLIIHMYSMELTKSENLIESFALRQNDFERIWMLYDYYIDLALSLGPDVSAAMMIIELNRNIGIYDEMMKARRWLFPLCGNCQKQGIIQNKSKPEELIPMVSAALNNFVFEWCRCRGDYPLKALARRTVITLLQVSEEYAEGLDVGEG